MKVDGKKLYKKAMQSKIEFDAEIHCPLVIDVISETGTLASFCVKAGISDRTFFRWLYAHDDFHECYRIGCMVARDNWEREGELGKTDENFNIAIWSAQGAARYGVGKTNRVRVHIDADTTPYEQYKQLLMQASMGDFTAAEFKQLVEGINVGIRAYESFELQREVNQMREDLEKMSQNHGNNIVSIAKTA